MNIPCSTDRQRGSFVSICPQVSALVWMTSNHHGVEPVCSWNRPIADGAGICIAPFSPLFSPHMQPLL
jgi:hypothetical protein